MILKALISLIEGDEALSLRLGQRVYAREAPQGIGLPFVVLNRISRVGIETLDGDSGLAWRRIQVDLYASTEAEMVVLANRLRTVLAAVAHQDVPVDQNSPPQTVRVQAVRLMNDNDLSDEPGFARRFRRSLDFAVVHNE